MSAVAEPKVSVCVVTYNQERYIRDCLQGIVDQKTDFPFEILVADDCSKDGTAAIVREFAARYPDIVRPILRQANLGATQNFLDVHNSARGSYVAHVDGDDLVLPGKLQKQVDFLDANPDFSVVWHRVNLFDDLGGFIPGEKYSLSSYPNGVVTLEHALRIGTVAAHSSIMYRRSARKTGRADCEIVDVFYTWEYLSSGKGKILEEVLGSYRVAAQGSLQLNRQSMVIRTFVHHVRYYLRLMPEQRRNIFVYSLINFMADVKRLRATAWSWGRLALESASLVSPSLVLTSIFEVRRVPPFQTEGSVQVARTRKASNQPR
jgi:glycosyltransferase involved in cell wall biosynthesis